MSINTQALLVLGPLGSGKTSFVKWLIGRNGKFLGKLRLIINDVGTENIDAGRLSEDTDLSSDDVVSLQSGCVCCEDLDALRKAMDDWRGKVDTMIIEPTGIAEGDVIKKTLEQLSISNRVVTLVDVLHHKQRKNVEKIVLETQVAVADVIGLTWWEGASHEQMEEVLDYLGDRNSRAPILKLNKLNSGENEIMGDAYYQERFHQQLLSILTASRFEQLAESNPEHKHSDKQEVIDQHDHDHNHDNDHAHIHGHVHNRVEQAPVFSRSFTDVAEEFGRADLENLLEVLSAVLIRAKGVIAGRRFNYVHGSLNWEKADSSGSKLNLISSEPIDDQKITGLLKNFSTTSLTGNQVGVAYQKDLDQLINSYLSMNKEEVLSYSQQETARLIAMYEEYMRLEKEITDLTELKVDSANIVDLQLRQKELGESMTFANPMIWLNYKVHAYRGTAKELRTLADLRDHCSSPTDICYKRYHYLRKVFSQCYAIDLNDENSLSGTLNLTDLITDHRLQDLSTDPQFMTKWQSHEYFKQVDGDRMRVAKWENYQLAQ